MNFDEYRQFKGLYESMKKGEKTKVIIQYAKMSQEPSRSMTVCEDTILHMAINMRHERIAREILKHHIKDPSTLTQKNVFGDNIIHEAASTNMTKLAKELLEKAPQLLSMPNRYGEMPLFKAAQFGQTEMFKFLAGEVEKVAPEKDKDHLSRNDKSTILHMTILAEYFDLGYMIAKKYRDLVAEKDGKGKIALQLLSSNPSAFRSGSSYGVPVEDGEIRKESSHEEEKITGGLDVAQIDEDSDEARGSKLPRLFEVFVNFYFMIMQIIASVFKKMNRSLWSLFREGWPMMGNIWKEKRKHESALRLAKLLIPEDTSWEHISTEEDKGKISVVNPAAEEHESALGLAKLLRLAEQLIAGDTSREHISTEEDKGKISVVSPAAEEHESALRLAKLLRLAKQLIAEDTSREHISTEEDKGKISVVSPAAKESEEEEEIREPKRKKQGGRKTIGKQGKSGASATMAQAADTSKINISDMEAGSAPTLTSLLLATSNGIVEIVKEIHRVYPQAVEHVSHMGQNILHVAIKHRQKEIFKMVKKMEIPMTRLVRRIDNKGYTLLHHVAVMQYYSGGTLPGPALQLQEELHWFERMREIIPPHYAMYHSSKGETAQEFFKRRHTKLLKDAQEWLKRTSESCSTVAVLIATVAFAAAYTVPGGSNQETGLPVLLHDPIFLVFTVMDVLSLASSLTSVVMFLSILTSPFQLQDFRHSLPRKLILGFSFLFLSVAVTMLAFTATILLIVHLKKRWTTLLIYTVAFLPVSIFAILQFPLYLTFMNTLKSSINLIKVAFPCNFVIRSVRTPLSSICKRH